MKGCLRRGMKVTWLVNLSTVGRVSVLSPNVTCLETTKFTKKKKRPVRPRSAGTLGRAARDLR